MKKDLMASASIAALIGPMSVAERARGRYMRDEGGHAPAPTPAPAPAPSEPAAPEAPKEVTAEDLEAEFGPASEPATPQDDNSEPGEDLDPSDPEAPKGKSAEERIAEQTAAQREAERQAAEARRERDAAIAERDELRKKASPEPESKDVKDPLAEPDPADYEFGEADTQFIRDTAAFTVRAELATQQRTAEIRTQLSDIEAGYAERAANPEFVAEHPDFQEKVVKGAEEGKWDCSPVMALGIKHSEFGPQIAYQLASNPEEATRIAGLTNLEQARELGKLEGREAVKAEAKAAKDKPAGKTQTDAPAPPANRARGAGGQFATEADTEDFAAFEAKADAILTGHRG